MGYSQCNRDLWVGVCGWMEFFFSTAQESVVAQGLSKLHYLTQSDTSHSVCLLWKNNQLDAGNFIWKYTTLTEDPVVIRTCNFRKREPVEPPLRLRWHWDRPLSPHKDFKPEVCIFSVFSSDISNTEILCCIKQTTIDSPYTTIYLFLFCSYVTKLFYVLWINKLNRTKLY